MDNQKTFPIITSTGRSNQAVPYSLVLSHEEQALKNHGQSVAQLARRGGLSWGELMCVLRDENLFSTYGQSLHQNEPKAYREYQRFIEEFTQPEKFPDPAACLEALLKFIPQTQKNAELQRVVDDCRKAVAASKNSTLRYVWLNLEDGSFSESWTRTDLADPEGLAHDVTRTAQPLYKLIEYRCLSDADFQFSRHMKLR